MAASDDGKQLGRHYVNARAKGMFSCCFVPQDIQINKIVIDGGGGRGGWRDAAGDFVVGLCTVVEGRRDDVIRMWLQTSWF